MAFWNLHVSFEHRQRGFKVPVDSVEVSLFYWRYKALNFSLHYNIKYFKNNNCFPSILNLFFFSVINASFSERFPEKSSTFHSHVGHYKVKFECSFHSRKYWSRVTWIDCNIIGMFHGLHDLICFGLRYVRLSSYRTRQILNLSTGDSVNERVTQAFG